jgi:ComF family protein
MGDGLCVNCRETRPEFERAASFGEYKEGLRGLIHLLKYEGITPAQAPLGQMLANAISELLLVPQVRPSVGPTLRQAQGRLWARVSVQPKDANPGHEPSDPLLLVPVPLHRSRRRSRGFNQAELIARAALKQLPHRIELVSELLIRRRETISQVGLSREERIENMRGAFRVSDRARLKGRNIIVVDDVMTTGTTLSECARVLKKAGANQVWAATVARASHGADLPEAADDGHEEEVEAAVLASV